MGHLIYREGNNPWQRLFSTSDTLPVIEGKITGIGYPAISEDRIAVRIDVGGKSHFIIIDNLGPVPTLPEAAGASPPGSLSASSPLQQGVGDFNASQRDLIGVWLREVARIAKMANLEAFVWQIEKRSLRKLYNLTREELEKQIEKNDFERMSAVKTVELAYEKQGDVLVVEVSFNSSLSEFLRKELFSKEYKSVEEIEQGSPRALQGFLKAKLSLQKFRRPD